MPVGRFFFVSSYDTDQPEVAKKKWDRLIDTFPLLKLLLPPEYIEALSILFVLDESDRFKLGLRRWLDHVETPELADGKMLDFRDCLYWISSPYKIARMSQLSSFEVNKSFIAELRKLSEYDFRRRSAKNTDR
jgi:hypothetical protein